MGNRMFGGESSHLPLKLNVSGVIPPIFASSILLMPTTVAAFQGNNVSGWMQTILEYLGPGQPLYFALYALMIIFFAFFYTSIIFNPEETAENLKKYGGFIPGIRPGKKTAEYIDYVLTRTTVIGALYLAIVCLIPEFMRRSVTTLLPLGGTSILIIVSVTMDTIAQIQSHLIAQQYEGLIKKTKLRGPRR
jgi:preprotein translocase subunit SecY